MISIQQFLEAVTSEDVLGKQLNTEQRSAITHGLDDSLMLVAGPGSGKTTVLVLRAIRHVLVDGFEPESVLLTTFTVKAASELRDRLILWGGLLVEHFVSIAVRSNDQPLSAWLSRLDVNAFQTGTLDSFIQGWLKATKAVGEPSRVLIDTFAAKTVYKREIFRKTFHKSPINKDFEALLKTFWEFRGDVSLSVGSEKSFELVGRLFQDLVDSDAWAQQSQLNQPSANTPESIQVQLLKTYKSYLDNAYLTDYTIAAATILDALNAGSLYPNPSVPTIGAILVDEYQDTNPIQEAIYLGLSRCSQAALTVVGDDDQALYRFRGATVELFTQFEARAKVVIKKTTQRIYLTGNYRSSPEIVDFFNRFATFDAAYQPARVAGKPIICATKPSTRIPVLGMFRSNNEELARDLNLVLEQMFLGSGYNVPGTDIIISKNPERGALGDAVFLASTVREKKDNDERTPRLPDYLRRELQAAGHGVFNPRGQDLRDIPAVRQLLGLVAMCIDQDAGVLGKLSAKTSTTTTLREWRNDASNFIGSDPHPRSHHGNGLDSFVRAWGARQAQRGRAWPEEWPLLDLLYKLTTWMPKFQSDPEHQIYLEAITRCISQGGNISAYGLEILSRKSEAPGAEHNQRSVQSILYDVLVPIAENEIEVDEALLFSFPRNRLNVMTIHQAKGLEFPVVIVDVGSDFKANHPKQRFRRFPDKPSPQALMEDEFAPHTKIGHFRTQRAALDRTFDDLIRQFYVAYSRPKHLLILVGNIKGVQYKSPIGNAALFWERGGKWTWRNNNPPLKKNTPLYPEQLGRNITLI
jgi:DNA helicase II / ATP-dependent DNA helicase PcrA